MLQTDLRQLFPFYSSKSDVLVYFDNAATTQRPQSIIDAIVENSIESNANIHRSVYYLAGKATDIYNQAREKIAKYINAKNSSEIIFTSGTTASINLVAYSFGEYCVGEGDEIIISEAEHHSNIVPWQLLCNRKKAVLKVLPINESGELCIEKLPGLITYKTKLVAVTHISNVLGVINPIKKIVELAHSFNVPVLIDGAQGIVHTKIDVQDIDCDFYVFSGHKIYGPTGTGVLYGKKEWLEKMPPFLSGGDMVGTVSYKETTFAPLPMKFEAGTQNFNSQSVMSQVVDFMEGLNDDELEKEYQEVSDYIYDALTSNPKINLYGVAKPRIPIFSFSVNGINHEDVATLLSEMNIAVRSGLLCAEPLMDRLKITGVVRVSLAPYNTMEEAKYFIKSLEKAISMLE